MVVENNEVFYFEGNITGDHLHIDIFRIQPRYRGKKMSYSVWKQIQEKYKMDITLEAFFTLIPYYTKMGFNNLGASGQAITTYLMQNLNVEVQRRSYVTFIIKFQEETYLTLLGHSFNMK